MNSLHAAVVRCAITFAAALPVVVPAIVASSAALAQDSTFMACARHTDRGQRIACLEDALDAALAAQESSPATSQARSAAPVVPAAPEVPPVRTQNPAPAALTANTVPETASVTPPEPEERGSLLERIRSFGQSDDSASISTDDSGKERLHDTISALEKRNQMWIVTLSTGQVWRQAYPRALNLRVGDDISIYQEGVGNGYRMATPRLSGFIRVERAR
jgi:hypothetical protein